MFDHWFASMHEIKNCINTMCKYIPICNVVSTAGVFERLLMSKGTSESLCTYGIEKGSKYILS